MSLPPLGVTAYCLRLSRLSAVGWCGLVAVALLNLVSAAQLSGPASVRCAELVRGAGGSCVVSPVVVVEESMVEALRVASGLFQALGLGVRGPRGERLAEVLWPPPIHDLGRPIG